MPLAFLAPSRSPRHLVSRLASLACAFLAVTLAACVEEGTPNPIDSSLSVATPGDLLGDPAGPAAAATLLERLSPEETGITHQNFLPFERRGKYLYVGAGVAAGDYDNDGLTDLYLVSQVGKNALYRNLGDWRFEEVTDDAGVAVTRSGDWGRFDERFPTGAYFFDADSDDDLDLFVTAFAGSNVFFRNNGDGTFEDDTVDSGLEYVGGSTSAAVADYDHDGDLDIYVATYRPFSVSEFYPATGREDDSLRYDVDPDSGMFLPEGDMLYRNNGDGTFEDAAEEAGVAHRDWGLAAAFADVTGDGWPELYVANDFDTPDRFYVNNRDGTFSPLDPERYRHTPHFSMGMDFGDVNNDGRIDIMSSDMLSPNRVRRQTQGMDMMMMGEAPAATPEVAQVMRNVMQLNLGDGYFVDVAPFAGVTATDWTWSVKFADLDLDGWQDLLITNGFVTDAMNVDEELQLRRLHEAGRTEEAEAFLRSRPELLTPNVAFRNQGGLRFEDVSAAWGFDHDGISNGMALADLDGDADLDVVLNNMNSVAAVYRNNADLPRLRVRLRPTESAPYGIGASLALETSEGTQYREMSATGGYLSSHEATVVFGLGEAAPELLRVNWPSGVESVVSEFPESGDLTVDESEGNLDSSDGAPDDIARDISDDQAQPQASLLSFESVALEWGIDHRHVDPPFDDFGVQPFLPLQLSRFGPGVTVWDGDGDGDDDIAIAGGAGQVPGVFWNQDGEFEVAGADAPEGETLALLWLDGGLVRSASTIEDEVPGLSGLRVEDGAVASDAWQETTAGSMGALAAADYDGDGWLDVFAGARSNPGAYPTAPDSLLLRGSSDGLEPVEDVVPDDLGMVAGAVWSDVDGDDDPDLLLATDWGPVRLLENEGGRLNDVTEAAGLAAHRGWWNGLATGDVDGDGDFDLVATNLGLNTRYQASDEEPLVLYADDFDGDGSVDVIETEWDNGQLYPLRSGMDFVRAMPELEGSFQGFQGFARTPIGGVLGDDKLEQALRLEANWLTTTLFINDGQGGFDATALPLEAQLSPGYGVVLEDLDNDGNLDIYMVQNFMGPEPMHTGPFDSGLSVAMLNDGEGSFTSVPPSQSGLLVPEDAKGLAASDLDGDGWIDLVVGVRDAQAKVFRNLGSASADGRSSITVQLEGATGNPKGVGARVVVTTPDGFQQTREVQAGGSFLSQSSASLGFGLGNREGPVAVTVHWPDGTITTVEAAPVGETVVVTHDG